MLDHVFREDNPMSLRKDILMETSDIVFLRDSDEYKIMFTSNEDEPANLVYPKWTDIVANPQFVIDIAGEFNGVRFTVFSRISDPQSREQVATGLFKLYNLFGISAKDRRWNP